jgi:alpha-L-fucosidase 2
MRIGHHGQLQEWLKDLDDPNDHHRHVSHLYGLFPSNQITPDGSAALFEAARNSLLMRGDASTGWSMGWKVNLWARLLEGNHALELIRHQLRLVEAGDSGGGTYPNLFDAHPPFQIDGNFGCTSGIAEMLLQTHAGAIHLLPALPDEWASDGAVAGLRAYGGFELDFTWKHGVITQLVVRSSLGGNARIRSSARLRSDGGTPLRPAAGDNPNPYFTRPVIKKPRLAAATRAPKAPARAHAFLYDLETEAGGVYRFTRND